ncbi:hypothetical protein ACHQM5_013244 [Ranunculus cassubicifolius]
MARINEPVFQIHDSTIKVLEDHEVPHESTAGSLSSKISLLLFYLHLIVVGTLISYLTIRGIISGTNDHRKNLLLHFYPPLLTSSLLSALIAFLCQLATRRKPFKTLKTVFWLSPLLTCAVGFFLLAIGTAGSFICSAIAFISAVIQSLYGCWVTPRIEYAAKILAVSQAAPVSKATSCLTVSLLVGWSYSAIAVLGLGWITQIQTRVDPVYFAIILLSLAWTMHVIRNTLCVAISRPIYAHFTGAMSFDTRVLLKDTVKLSLGSICIGSVLVPVNVVFRGLARAMSQIAGDTDEFMFSCASCYAGVADRVILYGNRWGFVHVGAFGKGFVRGSIDTWKMMEQNGMISLIDSDLTATFCFLCGVAGGSVCTLVSGSWALTVHKDFATQVSVYAFLIGYFIVRIAMSWIQACVSAYHVAYAKNPMSSQFGATIHGRILELQKSQV